jgi:DNA repair protein RecN (Recombination protein N)
MLIGLYVKNLAVIEDLRLNVEPGLTALSGDEGAGKSLLADALCLLLGARTSPGLVRSGASAALVEGIFNIPADDEDLAGMLMQAGLEPESDGSLILSREVHEQGRSIARVNGRAVPVSLLRELGQRLVDIHSQMEQLCLLSPSRQLDLLDRHGNFLERRSELARKVAELRESARELDATAGEDMKRQFELLGYQVAEIESASVHPGEDEALEQERRVLQRAQDLQVGCYAAYNTLYADDCCASGLMHQASTALRGLTGIDSSLREHLGALESATAQLEETAKELRCYACAVESDSARLQETEERLELLRRIKSKYGPTLDGVMEFRDRASHKLEALQVREGQRYRLQEETLRLQEEAGELAKELSRARQECAAGLTELVNRELTDLGMPWASFDIKLTQEESPDGLPAFGGTYSYSHLGIDRVEFLGTTNPGELVRPLAYIASGGETCRFMLALKSAFRHADPVPTLVFDEIDAGVGGRNGHVVGRKLAALAEGRQVICITHLPQVASFGQHHYRVLKESSSGRSTTRIERLEGGSRVEELADMLGGSADEPMLLTAQQLLDRAGEKMGSTATAVAA